MSIFNKITAFVIEALAEPEPVRLSPDNLLGKSGMTNSTAYYSGLQASLDRYWMGAESTDSGSALVRAFDILVQCEGEQAAFEFVVMVISMEDLAPSKYVMAVREFLDDGCTLSAAKASQGGFDTGTRDKETKEQSFLGVFASASGEKNQTNEIKEKFCQQLMRGERLSVEQLQIAEQFMSPDR